jgi:hypothetical protein
MARHHSSKARSLPPLLVRLIEAAKDSGNNGSAEALRSFGALALIALPTRGVLVPDDNDIGMLIECGAREHLGLEDAKRAFRRAIKAVECFEARDAIESAHNQVQGASDEAYFYAGLAFGVTLADFS